MAEGLEIKQHDWKGS